VRSLAAVGGRFMGMSKRKISP